MLHTGEKKVLKIALVTKRMLRLYFYMKDTILCVNNLTTSQVVVNLEKLLLFQGGALLT